MEQKKQKAEEAIRRYADMIYRLALSNVKSRHDAEDIFQDVCVALLSSSAPLDDDEHLRHWLIRATINKCKNFHKSVSRHRTEPLESAENICSEEHQSLYEELSSLPSKYRTVLYLYYYEGYSVKEVAKLLSLSENTVSSQLRRARKKLRLLLEE